MPIYGIAAQKVTRCSEVNVIQCVPKGYRAVTTELFIFLDLDTNVNHLSKAQLVERRTVVVLSSYP